METPAIIAVDIQYHGHLQTTERLSPNISITRCYGLFSKQQPEWFFRTRQIIKDTLLLGAVQWLPILPRIRSGPFIPWPRWAQGTWPCLLCDLISFSLLLTVFQPHGPLCCFPTTQKSRSHLRTFTPIVPMPGCSSLRRATSFQPLLKCHLFRDVCLPLSKLALLTTTLCSLISFIFLNTQMHICY